MVEWGKVELTFKKMIVGGLFENLSQALSELVYILFLSFRNIHFAVNGTLDRVCVRACVCVRVLPSPACIVSVLS